MHTSAAKPGIMVRRTCLPGADAAPGGQHRTEEGTLMAAMKPRTGDGPLEVVQEGRSIIMRVPLEGGGRLVVEIDKAEAASLRDALEGVITA